MLKKVLLGSVAALAMTSALSAPARAEVSFMYAEWIAALVEPGGKVLRGEHYEGPFEDELPVEEPSREEEIAAAKRQEAKGE